MKKPIYKHIWFWVVVVLILGAIGSMANPSTPTKVKNNNAKVETNTEVVEEITYTPVEAIKLFDDLKANAAKASKDWKNQYVEITGYLSTIDSDGKFFCVSAGDDLSYLFDSVNCKITNDAQLEKIYTMTSNDPITVTGKITDVGEVLGYYLDTIDIK